MTRDIEDRMELFVGEPVEVRRLALNWDQVQQYDPPPNPAKLTDTRAEGYIARFGMESWELDALEPDVLVSLVRDEIENTILDHEAWNEKVTEEEEHRRFLDEASDRWSEIVDFLAETS